jgi:hypothetical protein
MVVQRAFAYLIAPGKGQSVYDPVSSKEIALDANKLGTMLQDIFSSDPGAHDFDITFKSSSDGTQINECRELLVSFNSDPTEAHGRKIAERLQNFSDNRCGTGLLFVMNGYRGLKSRTVLSRFPTDQAILADINSGNLSVEFLEQVFIKRLSSYKAASFQHQCPEEGFWDGIATDRQAGRSGEHISEYWLKDFLNADFSETAAEGTRRLAKALKIAMRTNPNLEVKTELAHASSLVSSVFSDKSLSISDFCDHFALSEAARQTIKGSLTKPSLFSKKFMFDAAQFKMAAPFRTVEMDNGAILTAPNDEFESIFHAHAQDDYVEYRTRGKINDQRLAKK